MKAISISGIPVSPDTGRVNGQLSIGLDDRNQPYRDSHYSRQKILDGIVVISDGLYRKLDDPLSDILASAMDDFQCGRYSFPLGGWLSIGDGGRFACYPVMNGSSMAFLRMDRFSMGIRCSGSELYFTFIEEKVLPDYSLPDHEHLRASVLSAEPSISGFLHEAFMQCGPLSLGSVLVPEDRKGVYRTPNMIDASDLRRGAVISLPGTGRHCYVEEVCLRNDRIIAFVWGSNGSAVAVFRRGDRVYLREILEDGLIPAAAVRKGMRIRIGYRDIDIAGIRREGRFFHMLDEKGRIIGSTMEGSSVRLLGYDPVPSPDPSSFWNAERGMILHWSDRDTRIAEAFRSDAEGICHLILEDVRTGKTGYRTVSCDADLSSLLLR